MRFCDLFSVSWLLIATFFLNQHEVKGSSSSMPSLLKWRDFTYGRIRPDGIEYFDFNVPGNAFRVFLTFDRSDLDGFDRPQILLKFGGFPTLDDYDQQLEINTTSEFFNIQVMNLRKGKYFVALIGGNLYDSINTFVGKKDYLFYFVSIWYFGCSDPIWVGGNCMTPVVPIKPPSGFELPDNFQVAYMDQVNKGCLDENYIRLLYSVDLDHPEWDLSFQFTSTSSEPIVLTASPGLLDFPEIGKNSNWTYSITLPAAKNENKVTDFLHITAPKLGHWLIRVNGRVLKEMECANDTGMEFSFSIYHEKKCEGIEGTMLPSNGKQGRVNLCDVDFLPLNEMRREPIKEKVNLQASFVTNVPLLNNRSGSLTDHPVAGFYADVGKTYAGSNLRVIAYATSNIKSFKVYVRLDGYPTMNEYDYIFDSKDTPEVMKSDSNTFLWKYEVNYYKWRPITFPMIGRWYILVLADEAVTQNDKSKFWGIDISLETQGCPEEACSSHGQCSLEKTYQGLEYGSCDCHYGFGGDICSEETVDTKARSHQIFLLILSNIAILPVSILCCRRKLYIEAVLFFATGAISAVYHACDMEIFCLFSFRFLFQMDFAFSYNMILLLSVHLSGARKQAKAGFQAFFLLLTIFLVTRHSPASMINWVVIGAIAVVQFTCTLVYYLIMGFQRMKLPKKDALKSFLFRSDNFDVRFGGLGIILWIGALSCWFTSSPTNYWLVHSIWHMGAMIAAFCFIGLRKNDRYRMVNADNVDVLAPSIHVLLPLKVQALASPCEVELMMEKKQKDISTTL